MRRADPCRPQRWRGLALGLSIALAGCGSAPRPLPGDDAPTLAVLRSRSVTITPDEGPPRDDVRAAAAWRELLALAPAGSPERAAALRRLGDLELERGESEAGEGRGGDLRSAIGRYQAWLDAAPQASDRDAVLYQLARAHELGGDGAAALATLDRLVAAHPGSAWRDEAEFRRGEMLFAQSRWADAEAAYSRVLQAGAGSAWLDRALYMQGWARYRQGRWNEALESFFGVLDLTLGAHGQAQAVAAELPRAERERVDDTLRVTALALEQLQGAAAIEPHLSSPRRLAYAGAVYGELATLYERQRRVRDASDTWQRLAQRLPGSAAALQAQLRVIALNDSAGFSTRALEARRDFVRAAVQSPDPALQDALREHLDLLARHHHAEWQRTRNSAEADAAESWYALAEDRLHDARRGERRFLRAELLFEAGRWSAAHAAYAAAAYGDAEHTRRADAGHGELLALQRAGADAERQRQAARRFVQRFDGDARALAVRAQLAFDDGDFAAAEAAWARQLAATDTADGATRSRIGESLARAVARQAEAARDAGRSAQAAALFTRVAAEQPGSTLAAAALADAATEQIALRDWAGAVASLQALRQRHPGHALAARVPPQLALALAESGRPRDAAAELERWLPAIGDAGAARQARWQAATLYLQAGERARALPLLARVADDAGAPPAQRVQSHWQLAEAAREAGRTRDEQAALRTLRRIAGEGGQGAEGGDQADETLRTLSTRAALRLAEPLAAAYRQVALVEPLKATLARKKARFDAVQAAYAEAAAGAGGPGQAAVAVASAALYQDFGRAVLASPTPRGLRKADAEGYRVLLEEQALPFEDRAVELYTAVALRTRDAAWDEPVRQAYAALAQLRPLRWAKREAPGQGAVAQGRVAREAGRFDEAEAWYQQALAADATDAAARLNLAILLDLYRHDAARALPHYRALQHQAAGQALGQGPAELPRWIAELEQRLPRQARAAPPGVPR